MKALARPEVARVPGGRATSGHEDIRLPDRPDPDGWDQTLADLGYTWCRPCVDHHRPPECWIDEEGRPALHSDSFRS